MSLNQSRNFVEYQLAACRYWTTRLLPDVELSPGRIAVAYLLVGIGALYASDVLLVRYVSEPLLGRIQALKGGVEVVLTAGFIYLLTARRETQLHRSRRRIDQQREELEVLHRVLRHNLRNDLNVIEGCARTLEDRLPADRLDGLCRKILDTADKVIHYTEQANRIRSISNRNGQVRTHDLTEVIPELVGDYSTDDADVSVRLPARAKVEAAPMFLSALGEVVTNAITHNDAETPQVGIDVRTGVDPAHMVAIRVADNGPGIPKSELEPLREGREEQILHLSGMGLWFVKWVVRHSDGELVFRRNDRGGTTVEVRVPKAPEMLSPTLSPMNGD